MVASVMTVWLGGCRPGEPAGPMLHAIEGYAGTIQVTPDGGTAPPQSYQLSFARSNSYFAVKLQVGKRVITLLHDSHGPPASLAGVGQLQVFEDHLPRPATAAEKDHFALVRDLVNPRQVEAFEPGPTTYKVRRKGAWYRIRLVAEAPGFHGGSPAGK